MAAPSSNLHPDILSAFDPTAHAGEIDPAHAATGLGKMLAVLGGGNAADIANPDAGTTDALTSRTATTPLSTTPTTPTTPTSNAKFGHPTAGTETYSQGYHGDTGGQAGAGPGDNHPGVDISVPNGTPVLAATAGIVTHAASDDPNGYGTWVEVTAPDGMVTRYGHLSGLNVTQGQTVSTGALLGPSGSTGNSTGPHLHFEVRIAGNTVDPIPYLAGGAAPVGTGDMPAGATAAAQANPAAQPEVTPEEKTSAGVLNSLDVLGGKSPSHSTKTQAATTPGAGTTTGTGSTGDSDPGAIDAFLNATKQHESTGNYQARYSGPVNSDAAGAYQFLSTTWKSAGGSTASAADASPAEQDSVARSYATQLFNQFHSWRLVAIAWYGGPGKAAEVAAGKDPGSPEGQGPYLAYADTIQKMMAGGK